MNTSITNTNETITTVEGRGLVSKYNPGQDNTSSIAHSFHVADLASVEECMKVVAELCEKEDLPVIKDSKEAAAYLATWVVDIDQEWEEGLVTIEDADESICTLMWLIASLTNAKWFEVFIDQGEVLFWSMTAEEFAKREQQLGSKYKQLAA